MTLNSRLLVGSLVNLVLGTFLVSFLASWSMRVAGRLTGAEYGWPQMNFMSAYPDHIRNGYFMFVFAVLMTIVLLCGVSTRLLGASPGRAALGVRYVEIGGHRATLRAIAKRTLLIVLIAAFLLLAGPILGFLFGTAADGLSLIALAAGVFLAFWSLGTVGTKAVSRVDQASGLRAVIRFKKEE